jgi:hypothetical protein
VSGAIAPLATGVAGLFMTDGSVPRWLVVALFLSGCLYWLGALFWIFHAYRRLAAQTVGHELVHHRITSDAAVWRRVHLVASVMKVILNPSDAKRLAGQLVKITMVRPGDGVEAPYPLRLKGGLEGYSNMLAASESCVEARVYFFREAEQGAATETSCQLEDS